MHSQEFIYFMNVVSKFQKAAPLGKPLMHLIGACKKIEEGKIRMAICLSTCDLLVKAAEAANKSYTKGGAPDIGKKATDAMDSLKSMCGVLKNDVDVLYMGFETILKRIEATDVMTDADMDELLVSANAVVSESNSAVEKIEAGVENAMQFMECLAKFRSGK